MKSPLIVIVGETASGKSALALLLAQQFDGEIICADSSTVRRDLNIGSAKPSLEEQKLVPHHLLDVVAADESFSAARFKDLAQAAIDDITGRGKLPIMVGGTGLYIDGVLYDYSFREQADPALHEELSGLGADELLARIDQEGIELGDVDTHNKYRLVRLLETGGVQPERRALRKDTVIIGLQMERDVLRQRVEARVDHMLEAGLEDEVRALCKQYEWGSEALKGVGYAQWQEYFAGTQNLAETRRRITKATMDLAKRQRTWFRRNKSIHWLGTPVNLEEVVDLVTTRLDK